MSVLEHLPTGDVWRSGQVAVPKNLPVYGTMDKCLYLNTYLLEVYGIVDKCLYLNTYMLEMYGGVEKCLHFNVRNS